MARPIKVTQRLKDNGKKALGILPQGPDYPELENLRRLNLLSRYSFTTLPQSPSLIKDFHPSYFT